MVSLRKIGIFTKIRRIPKDPSFIMKLIRSLHTMSTTVAGLRGLMRCFGTCLFVRGLWSDISGELADVHFRTDANKLVTIASTSHQPEQKESMRLIQTIKTRKGAEKEPLNHLRVSSEVSASRRSTLQSSFKIRHDGLHCVLDCLATHVFHCAKTNRVRDRRQRSITA